MAPRVHPGWVVPSALLFATALVVLLAIQNRALREDYAALLEQTRLPHPGLPLPTFETVTMDGKPVTIGRSPDGARQILFIFDTSCPYCEASLPAWKKIATALDTAPGDGIDVYGISLDAADTSARYAAQHGLSFPILTFPEAKLAALYRSRVVPQLLLLDSAGVVLYARPGVLEGKSGDRFGPPYCSRSTLTLGG